MALLFYRTDEICGTQFVYRKTGTRFEKDHILETHRSGRVGVPIWSWMDASGPGQLHKIEGKLTSVKYVEILEKVFLPAVEARYGRNTPFRFIHDRSPIHKGNVVKAWFAQRPHIDVLPWPPKGADLNVIENAWSSLKSRTGSVRNYTRDQLFVMAQEQWAIMSRKASYWDNLVSSTPHRLQMVQEAEGGWTKY